LYNPTRNHQSHRLTGQTSTATKRNAFGLGPLPNLNFGLTASIVNPTKSTAATASAQTASAS